LTSAIRLKQARVLVLEGLTRLESMGLHATESSASPSFLPRLLLQYGMAGSFQRQDLVRATRAMMTDGELARVVVGKYGNRSPKYGLKAAG